MLFRSGTFGIQYGLVAPNTTNPTFTVQIDPQKTEVLKLVVSQKAELASSHYAERKNRVEKTEDWVGTTYRPCSDESHE